MTIQEGNLLSLPSGVLGCWRVPPHVCLDIQYQSMFADNADDDCGCYGQLRSEPRVDVCCDLLSW